MVLQAATVGGQRFRFRSAKQPRWSVSRYFLLSTRGVPAAETAGVMDGARPFSVLFRVIFHFGLLLRECSLHGSQFLPFAVRTPLLGPPIDKGNDN